MDSVKRDYLWTVLTTVNIKYVLLRKRNFSSHGEVLLRTKTYIWKEKRNKNHVWGYTHIYSTYTLVNVYSDLVVFTRIAGTS